MATEKLQEFIKKYNIEVQEDNGIYYYRAQDLAGILNITNCHTSTVYYPKEEKKLLTTNTTGGPQKCLFLNENGVKRLIVSSRKQDVCKIAEYFDVGILDYKHLPTETETMMFIQRCFCDENIVREYNIGSYRLDMYFVDYKLAIECDEEKHNNQQIQDQERQEYLETVYGITFLRYKPQRDKLEVAKVINQIHNFILAKHDKHKSQKQIECENKLEDDIQSFNFIRELRLKGVYDAKNDAKEQTQVIQDLDDKPGGGYQGLDVEQNIRIKQQLLDEKQLELESKRLELEKDRLEIIREAMANKDAQNLLPYIASSVSVGQQPTPEIVTQSIETRQEPKPEPPSREQLPDLQEKFKDVPHNKPRKNTRQRKVQKYDPTTFELIKTYDGLMDAVRQNPTYSKGPLKDAAENSRVYNGFRWHFIDRDEPDIAYELPPTYERPSSSPKHIAMLNQEKTEILDVFSSMGKAQQALGIKSKESINTSIKLDYCVQNKYYFKFFEDCSEPLRNAYLRNHTLPQFNFTCCTKIEQLDPATSKVVQTYNSIADVLKVFCVSREVLKRACDSGDVRMGYKWRYA